MSDLHERMQKCVDAFVNKLSSMRAGRASAALLDKIIIDSYGIKTNLKHAANVTVADDRTLMVRVWDKANLNSSVAAILNSDLGVSPSVDSEGNIRVSVPLLTQEWREKLVRLAAQESEKARVAVRAVRRDLMDEIKVKIDNHEMSRDDYDKEAEKIQQEVDKYIGDIDSQLHEKQKEITTV